MGGIGDMIMRRITKKGINKAMKSGKKMLGNKGKKGGGKKGGGKKGSPRS